MKKETSGTTSLYAVIGDPISHTASPKMHNFGYEKLGIDAHYMAFQVSSDQLENALEGMRALGIRGFNVTVPHKEAVVPLLDELDPLAKAIGAVNTIVNHSGKLVGYNTDGLGFILSLKEGNQCTLTNKKVAILGGGGSAKSLAHTFMDHSLKELVLLNRTLDKATQLANQLPKTTAVKVHSLDQTEALKDCDVIINTTSVGLAPNLSDTPLTDFNWVRADQIVVDIIYNPRETEFLKNAKSRGAKTLNGAGMLAGQGVLAFEKFTGQTVAYNTFLDVLLA